MKPPRPLPTKQPTTKQPTTPQPQPQPPQQQQEDPPGTIWTHLLRLSHWIDGNQSLSKKCSMHPQHGKHHEHPKLQSFGD